jgi:hypothetical protein
VIDYMVMEAVAVKVSREDEKRAKEEEAAAKKKEWKKDKSELEKFR